jgi:CheY-like chemotaxis protein
VEDEEALTTLLRYNLDAEGYDVETVGRGDDADTRLKERVPDLIVLDWMLPGLSGIELCRRRRLHCQAVLGAGIAGAGEGTVAPRQPRAPGHRPYLWRHRA